MIFFPRQYVLALQKKMVWFLLEKWDILVDRATISRFPKKNKVSRKLAEWIGKPQINKLGLIHRAEALFRTVDLLVFIDESLSNGIIGWQFYAYSAISQPGRFYLFCCHRHFWSVLPAYTIKNYLLFRGIKKGYFNAEWFYSCPTDKSLAHFC